VVAESGLSWLADQSEAAQEISNTVSDLTSDGHLWVSIRMGFDESSIQVIFSILNTVDLFVNR
jgi:hypothetical protein